MVHEVYWLPKEKCLEKYIVGMWLEKNVNLHRLNRLCNIQIHKIFWGQRS